MIFILFSICLIGLIIGSYTDFKTREVPDWLNYGLIFAGLGLRALFSGIFLDWSYIIEGILGFGIFFILAIVMFYTGQWGGGDSKMLMGLGALIGLTFEIDTFLAAFFINLLFVGAIYGMVWMAWLIISKWKTFVPVFKKEIVTRTKMKLLSFVLGLTLLIAAFFTVNIQTKLFLLIGGAGTPAVFYLWIAIKAVEKTCMIKEIPVSKLTEGDWIVDDVKHGKKVICGPKDLGISKKQIAELKKLKISKVVVKEGIPFIPSFLLSFLVTLGTGNLILFFLL